MKQIILFLFFSFSIASMQAYVSPVNGDSSFDIVPTISMFDNYNEISIFPNPATEYISIANDSNVKQIIIFNVVGRKMKTFDAISGQKYNVSELPNGMYLIQLRDHNMKVLTTQRISKR